MAFDFPASPAIGAIYDTGLGMRYRWDGTAWLVVPAMPLLNTAQARNRLVNPAMQVSQENANTLMTANGAFPAD